jgi:hypothetical protein
VIAIQPFGYMMLRGTGLGNREVVSYGGIAEPIGLMSPSRSRSLNVILGAAPARMFSTLTISSTARSK